MIVVSTTKKTAPDHLTKIYSLITTHSTAPYAGGVDQFSVNHNMGYIPPFKVFYQSDDHPERWFAVRTNYDNNVPSATINTYTKFTCVIQVTKNTISFAVTNRDTLTHTIKIMALMYAEDAAAQQ